MTWTSTAASTWILLLFVCASSKSTENTIKCYECNRFRGGTGTTCKEGQGAWNIGQTCYGCIKIHTRVAIHNMFRKKLELSHESRSCIRKDLYLNPAGCTVRIGVGSLLTECFCYSDLCNGATSVRTSSGFTQLGLFCAVWILTSF